MAKSPLNGEKTHPLKPGSIAVLRELSNGPVFAYQINPGVRDRLIREGLAEARFSALHDKSRYWITIAGRMALTKLEGKP
jgi:hypothetical protein